MTNCFINEKELELVSGGARLAGENTSPKYNAQDKVQFKNPNNTAEVMNGLIQSVLPCAGENGAHLYTIMAYTSDMEAEHLAGRPYRVSEDLIIGLIA